MAKPGPRTQTGRMTTGSSQPKRKPGRPRKTPLKEDNPAPKRRGRPPKNAPTANADTDATPATLNTSNSPGPKRMGRPPKNAVKADADTDASPTVPKKTKAPGTKRMGRPPKVKTAPEQHQEQAQSSQAEAQEPVVLEVIGTSIQPSFVVQDPSSPRLLVVTEASPGSSQGLLNKLPSRKEASMAKKLAVKKTQAMKKTTAKKVAQASEAAAEAAEEMQQTASSWGSAVWNTITAPVSFVARRLSGTVQQMEH